MDDLIAFIKARLDEDEAVALACISGMDQVRMRRGTPPPRWVPVEDSSDVRSEDGILRVKHTWVRERDHICRHDPARVLRDVEAKRAILRRCSARMNEMDQYPNGLVSPRALLARQILMDIAAIWNDHADYQDATA